MQSKHVRRILTIAAILFLVVFGFYIFENLNMHLALSRNYPELEAGIDENILAGNVILVPESRQTTGTVQTFRYGVPASGFIFDRDGNTYYALTANHAFQSDFDNWIVLTHTQKLFPISDRTQNEMPEYYSQFPRSQVEYADAENDVAIISFQSKEELTVLPFAQNSVLGNEKIAVISSPEGYERNMVTYGKVLSTESEINALSGKRKNVFLHSAFIDNGSSGSLVLNKNMEICGLNIARADFLWSGKFRNSAAVPSETLLAIIEEWRKTQA